MGAKYDPFLRKLREEDGGSGGDFNPSGIYPELTAGNLAAKEMTASKAKNLTLMAYILTSRPVDLLHANRMQ